MDNIESNDAEKLVASIGIPPRPAIVLKVMEEKGKDEPDLGAVTKAIGTDVGLSAALLKTINSPLYGMRREVTSIPQAVALLGFDNVATLVTSLSLKTSLSAHGMERFWDQSARVGLLAAWLSDKLGMAKDQAHLFGLFRDAGIPLMMAKYPDYKNTLQLANQDAARSFTAVEDARHGVNHAVVGALLARNWRLPAVLHDAVLNHHDPAIFHEDSDSTVRQLVALGHLAGFLENQSSRPMPDMEWVKYGHSARAWLMLTEEDEDDLVEEARSLLLFSGM